MKDAFMPLLPTSNLQSQPRFRKAGQQQFATGQAAPHVELPASISNGILGMAQTFTILD